MIKITLTNGNEYYTNSIVCTNTSIKFTSLEEIRELPRVIPLIKVHSITNSIMSLNYNKIAEQNKKTLDVKTELYNCNMGNGLIKSLWVRTFMFDDDILIRFIVYVDSNPILTTKDLSLAIDKYNSL